VIYVRDVSASVRFYAQLGLVEQAGGVDDQWRWAYLKGGEAAVLLAANATMQLADPGPLLLYLRITDVEEFQRQLVAAGVAVEHLGYPDHAPGGEVKVVDPDGHSVLVGQVTGAPPADHTVMDSTTERTNILVRAAQAAERRGVAPQLCQAPTATGKPCSEPAKVKLADSWGDSLWTCLPHAEDIMLNSRAAFIANEDSDGLAAYLRLRRR
jgi:catechol 2,3-dioxygenase-like lactoylglutathione lyase family enzyme